MKTASKEIIAALSKFAGELNKFFNHQSGKVNIEVNENICVELVSNVDGYICSFVSSDGTKRQVVNYSVDYLHGLKNFYKTELLKIELCGYLFDHEIMKRFSNDEHFVSYVLNEYNIKQSVHTLTETPNTSDDIQKCIKGIRYLFNSGEILSELECAVF